MVTPPFDPDDDFPFSGGFPEAPRAARAGPGDPGPGGPPERAGAGDPAVPDEGDFDPEDPEDPEDDEEDWDEPRGSAPGEGPRPARPGAAEGERAAPDWDRVREAAWRVGQRARRHERVLHTRISRELAGDLRRAADDLRVPVSNLVRNVLEEAFGAVERVSDEVGGFLEDVLSEADPARDDVRRLRRGLHRLARRGRRGARRRFGDASPGDDAAEDAGRFAERGELDPAASPAREEAPPTDRVSTTLRESGVFRPRGADLPFPEVLGWQPLLLNAAAPCACGERTLPAGEEAYVAVTERGLSRTFLCGTCMRARGEA